MRIIIIGCDAVSASLIRTIIIYDLVEDTKDWILPKAKPLFNQVHSRRPINNPIAGRCY